MKIKHVIIVFVLGLALAWPAGHSAQAATPRYVDGTGSCAGNSPCYTTITLAVKASVAGDTIYIFPGTYAESVNLSQMATEGDITIITVNTAGTPTPGTATVDPAAPGGPGTGRAVFNITNPFPGNVTINGLNVTSPNSNGLGLRVNNDVLIENVTADNKGDTVNFADGIAVTSQEGNITIKNTTSRGGGKFYSNGFNLGAVAGNISLENSTANDNIGSDRNDGFEIISGNQVNITDCTASDNSFIGFNITNVGDVTIEDTVADRNGRYGFWIEATGKVTISSSQADSSGIDAFHIDTTVSTYATGFNALAGSVEISDSAGNNSLQSLDGDGLEIRAEGDVTVTRTSAIDNAQEGIDIEYAGGNVTMNQCTADGNGGEGLDTDVVDGNISIQGCVVTNNVGEGVEIAYYSLGGTASVEGSVVCTNTLGGVWSYVNANVAGEGNWWGDTTGPTHPNNAGGTGETVVDGSNGGSGTVDYTPWIDTVNGSASPASEGSASNLNFQFSGGSSTVFLGKGPGDPNLGGPFTLTTDNGILISPSGSGAQVNAFINQENGILAVSLVPATQGTATVTLTGPCGLAGSVQVDVTEPKERYIYLPLIIR
jgi:hypothetical protein